MCRMLYILYLLNISSPVRFLSPGTALGQSDLGECKLGGHIGGALTFW